MAELIAAVKSFVRDDEGATMVEYGLMVALIAVACIASVTLLGTTLSGLFDTVKSAISTAAAA